MKRCLVVVDYQKDFVTGSLGFPGATELEDAICKKIETYQQKGDDVVVTLDTHGEDYLQTQEGQKLPIPHCIKGTEGWQLYGRVDALTAGCPKFEKETFGSSKLYEFLKQSGYDAVELVGLVSNICVISNAVLAKTALPQAEIIVDSACTASGDREIHQKTLDVLKGLQVTVI